MKRTLHDPPSSGISVGLFSSAGLDSHVVVGAQRRDGHPWLNG